MPKSAKACRDFTGRSFVISYWRQFPDHPFPGMSARLCSFFWAVWPSRPGSGTCAIRRRGSRNPNPGPRENEAPYPFYLTTLSGTACRKTARSLLGTGASRRFPPEFVGINTSFLMPVRGGTSLGTVKGTKENADDRSPRNLRKTKDFRVPYGPLAGTDWAKMSRFAPPIGDSIPPYGDRGVGRNTDESAGYLLTSKSLEEC